MLSSMEKLKCRKHYELAIATSQLQTDAQKIEDEIAEILRQERERT